MANKAFKKYFLIISIVGFIATVGGIAAAIDSSINNRNYQVIYLCILLIFMIILNVVFYFRIKQLDKNLKEKENQIPVQKENEDYAHIPHDYIVVESKTIKKYVLNKNNLTLDSNIEIYWEIKNIRENMKEFKFLLPKKSEKPNITFSNKKDYFTYEEYNLFLAPIKTTDNSYVVTIEFNNEVLPKNKKICFSIIFDERDLIPIYSEKMQKHEVSKKCGFFNMKKMTIKLCFPENYPVNISSVYLTSNSNINISKEQNLLQKNKICTEENGCKEILINIEQPTFSIAYYICWLAPSLNELEKCNFLNKEQILKIKDKIN